MNLNNLLEWDKTIFDEFEVPKTLFREDIVNEILEVCWSLTPCYNSPILFKQMVNHYFKTRKSNFEKLIDTTMLIYDPIENYNRNETITRDVTRDSSRDGTHSESLGTERELNVSGSSETSGSNTQTESVAPYNDETFHNSSKADGENKQSGTTSGDTSENVTEDREIIKEENENTTEKETITNHTSGNIGVTTSQQMIDEERRVVKFNILEYIAKDFKQRFFILVW